MQNFSKDDHCTARPIARQVAFIIFLKLKGSTFRFDFMKQKLDATATGSFSTGEKSVEIESARTCHNTTV